MEYIFREFINSNPKYFFITGTAKVSDFVIYPKMDYYFLKADVRGECKDTIAEITESWMSEIEQIDGDIAKEEYICKKIADHVEYGDPSSVIPNSTSELSQTIGGSLYRKKAVCKGYTSAMVYFCNAAGIECFTAYSEGHAWNIIKLDGIWYESDVTWYDTTEYNQKWLNISRYTMLRTDERGCHNYSNNLRYWEIPKCDDDLEKRKKTN